MSGVRPSLTPEVLAALTSSEVYPTPRCGNSDGPGARPPAPPSRDAHIAHGARMEHVQTHLSHVFLGEGRVYKFRKSVSLGFVDFSTRAERNADCLREVALNRRLAPDVYLGVAPLWGDPGRGDPVRVGPVAEGLAADGAGGGVPEHCVVMRRLPADRDALTLLERGQLSGDDLERLAAVVVDFHDRVRLGTPSPFTPELWRRRCMGPAEDSFRLLGGSASGLVPDELLRGVAGRASSVAEASTQHFERRRRAGCAVDGHGDLHLQHVWLETDAASPLVIDCLEFSGRLRRIDAASEVAFLAMDLRYRGFASLAERFLCAYARLGDDFDLYSVVDYFAMYRAAVRAKVASIAAADGAMGAAQRAGAAASTLRHLELAAELLETRPTRGLVLVGGVVGTGKSTAAARLAEELDGVVIASDRVRKALAGLAPTARVGSVGRRDLYAPARTERVYAGLLERARPVLASGRAAILDATFSRRAHREAARALAGELGAPCLFVETRCDPELARARLARRQASDDDPSDAGPDLHAASVAGFEPAGAAEPHRVVRTDVVGWEHALREIARDLPS